LKTDSEQRQPASSQIAYLTFASSFYFLLVIPTSLDFEEENNLQKNNTKHSQVKQTHAVEHISHSNKSNQKYLMKEKLQREWQHPVPQCQYNKSPEVTKC